jgi:hypothetical protein
MGDGTWTMDHGLSPPRPLAISPSLTAIFLSISFLISPLHFTLLLKYIPLCQLFHLLLASHLGAPLVLGEDNLPNPCRAYSHIKMTVCKPYFE